VLHHRRRLLVMLLASVRISGLLAHAEVARVALQRRARRAPDVPACAMDDCICYSDKMI
jgi:hypothetical protein